MDAYHGLTVVDAVAGPVAAIAGMPRLRAARPKQSTDGEYMEEEPLVTIHGGDWGMVLVCVGATIMAYARPGSWLRAHLRRNVLVKVSMRRRGWSAGLVALLLALAWASVAGTPDTVQVPDTLAQRMAACSSCHGKHGQGGGDGFNPRLAGKPTLYLYHQLLNFREGRRSYPMMQHMVTGLSDTYLHEMAAHFSALNPPYEVPATSPYPASVLALGRKLAEHGDAERKVPACQACHGKRLTGLEPAIPALLGLPRDYINNQFGAWRNGSRKTQAPDCMAKVASRLSGREISALAAWLSSQPMPEDAQPAPAGSLDLPLECGSMEK